MYKARKIDLSSESEMGMISRFKYLNALYICSPTQNMLCQERNTALNYSVRVALSGSVGGYCNEQDFHLHTHMGFLREITSTIFYWQR
jgi:hypothetical protein